MKFFSVFILRELFVLFCVFFVGRYFFTPPVFFVGCYIYIVWCLFYLLKSLILCNCSFYFIKRICWGGCSFVYIVLFYGVYSTSRNKCFSYFAYHPGTQRQRIIIGHGGLCTMTKIIFGGIYKEIPFLLFFNISF